MNKNFLLYKNRSLSYKRFRKIRFAFWYKDRVNAGFYDGCKIKHPSQWWIRDTFINRTYKMTIYALFRIEFNRFAFICDYILVPKGFLNGDLSNA